MSLEVKDQLVADDTTVVVDEETNQDIQTTSNPLLGLSKEDLISRLNLANAEAGKHRKRGSAAKQELEDKLNKERKEQGKFKEMYHDLQKQHTALQGGLKRGMTLSHLKDELLKNGCNPTMVEKAIKHADIDDVDVDTETMRPDADQISFIAKHVKEEVPVFFGKGVGTIKDGVPGPGVKTSTSGRVKDLSDDDLEKVYKEAIRSL